MESSLKQSIYLEEKNIYILSSAGKPIYSWKGDEQQLSTLTGLIQAIISVCLDSGDTIKSIVAGRKRFVFLIKEGLYFLAVASNGESEEYLQLQLEYLYHQILFILTSKVHKVLTSNPKYDLRSLLGGMQSTLHALFEDVATDGRMLASAIVPSALPSGGHALLAKALSQNKPPDLLYGILFHKGQLAALVQPEDTSFQLRSSDLLLLSNFVMTQASLKGNESWTPLCLPRLQAQGFMQAYIAHFEDFENQPPTDTRVPRKEGLYLLLLSTGNTPDHFHTLKQCRDQIEQEIQNEETIHVLEMLDIRLSSSYATEMAQTISALHFTFIYKHPSLQIRQCISSDFHFTLSSSSAQKRILNMYQNILLQNRTRDRVHEKDEQDCPPSEAMPNSSAISIFETSFQDKRVHYHRLGPYVYMGISHINFELFATFSATQSLEEIVSKCESLHQMITSNSGVDLFVFNPYFW